VTGSRQEVKGGDRLSLLQMVLRIPGFLLAISVHEYSHARTAFRLGDDTAERAGRMTIEPWAHIDVVGALMLLMFGFGWASPVPVDPYRLRNPRKDMAKVALAGPVANFITFAILQMLVVLLVTRVTFAGTRWAYVPDILQKAAIINASLGLFNLIPVPPLDGSRILAVFLPPSMADTWGMLERYGFVILVVLLVTNVIGAVLGPILEVMLALTQTLAFSLSKLVFPVRPR